MSRSRYLSAIERSKRPRGEGTFPRTCRSVWTLWRGPSTAREAPHSLSGGSVFNTPSWTS